jgi:hypothetical protein
MGVVITRNGHLILLIHESLFGPDLFVEEWVKFFEVFFIGIDVDIIVEDVLGSELLSHAEELGEELAAKCA